MMCRNLPGSSFKNFQQTFPTCIAVFLSDIGINSYLESVDFMPHLTPSDKILDYCVLIHEQFVFCKIADFFNKGAISSACHDKGNRPGLGRIILTLAFCNQNLKCDPSWHDGVISLTLNCDRVKSKYTSNVDYTNKKPQRLRPCMSPDYKTQLSAARTDAGGGVDERKKIAC